MLNLRTCLRRIKDLTSGPATIFIDPAMRTFLCNLRCDAYDQTARHLFVLPGDVRLRIINHRDEPGITFAFAAPDHTLGLLIAHDYLRSTHLVFERGTNMGNAMDTNATLAQRCLRHLAEIMALDDDHRRAPTTAYGANLHASAIRLVVDNTQHP